MAKYIGIFCGTGYTLKDTPGRNEFFDPAFSDLSGIIQQDKYQTVKTYDGPHQNRSLLTGQVLGLGVEPLADKAFADIKAFAKKYPNSPEKHKLLFIGHSRGCLVIQALIVLIHKDPTLKDKFEIVTEFRDPVPGNLRITRKLFAFSAPESTLASKFADLSHCTAIKEASIILNHRPTMPVGFSSQVANLPKTTTVRLIALPGHHSSLQQSVFSLKTEVCTMAKGEIDTSGALVKLGILNSLELLVKHGFAIKADSLNESFGSTPKTLEQIQNLQIKYYNKLLNDLDGVTNYDDRAMHAHVDGSAQKLKIRPEQCPYVNGHHGMLITKKPTADNEHKVYYEGNNVALTSSNKISLMINELFDILNSEKANSLLEDATIAITYQPTYPVTPYSGAQVFLNVEHLIKYSDKAMVGFLRSFFNKRYNQLSVNEQELLCYQFEKKLSEEIKNISCKPAQKAIFDCMLTRDKTAINLAELSLPDCFEALNQLKKSYDFSIKKALTKRVCEILIAEIKACKFISDEVERKTTFDFATMAHLNLPFTLSDYVTLKSVVGNSIQKDYFDKQLEQIFSKQRKENLVKDCLLTRGQHPCYTYSKPEVDIIKSFIDIASAEDLVMIQQVLQAEVKEYEGFFNPNRKRPISFYNEPPSLECTMYPTPISENELKRQFETLNGMLTQVTQLLEPQEKRIACRQSP